MAIAVFALAFGAGWGFQRRLIYFPERLEGPLTLPVGFDAQVVKFPSKDGVEISGLFAPPKDAARPVLLIAHGNAGSIREWAPTLARYARRGYGGLLLDPRGYGFSEGAPSEEGWALDGQASMEWLAAKGIDASRIVLHGVSIGGGIVVPLATAYPVRGLILESAFTSLVDVAKVQYPWFPVSWILRDRYENLAKAPSVRCPVLLLHGTEDEIVPVSHAERLARAFPGRVSLHIAPGITHNALPHWDEYEARLDEFLVGVE